MRKLVLTLVALIAVVTFIRAYDITAASSPSGELLEAPPPAAAER